MSETIHNQHEVPERELAITPDVRLSLLSASRWAKFISIVGFVLVGLYVVCAIASMVVGKTFISRLRFNSEIISYGSTFGTMSTESYFPFIFGITYILVAVICFFPIFFLYRFATGTQRAMLSGDESSLSRGMRNMKYLYTFQGIVLIVGLLLILFTVVMAVIAAALW